MSRPRHSNRGFSVCPSAAGFLLRNPQADLAMRIRCGCLHFHLKCGFSDACDTESRPESSGNRATVAAVVAETFFQADNDKDHHPREMSWCSA